MSKVLEYVFEIKVHLLLLLKLLMFGYIQQNKIISKNYRETVVHYHLNVENYFTKQHHFDV